MQETGRTDKPTPITMAMTNAKKPGDDRIASRRSVSDRLRRGAKLYEESNRILLPLTMDMWKSGTNVPGLSTLTYLSCAKSMLIDRLDERYARRLMMLDNLCIRFMDGSRDPHAKRKRCDEEKRKEKEEEERDGRESDDKKRRRKDDPEGCKGKRVKGKTDELDAV